MKLFFKKVNKLNRGFTLVETLVAVSIFTMSVLTLIIMLSQGLASTFYAKQKMTAGHLAQEGIEYIRNMRDTYVLYSADAQTGWDAFKTKVGLPNTICAQSNGDGCYFNADNVFSLIPPMPMTQISFTPCTSTICSNGPLYYDSTTGKYNNSFLGINSGYSRQIKISQINVNEIKVSSNVYWTQGSGQKSISFTENLFNWIEQ